MVNKRNHYRQVRHYFGDPLPKEEPSKVLPGFMGKEDKTLIAGSTWESWNDAAKKGEIPDEHNPIFISA